MRAALAGAALALPPAAAGRWGTAADPPEKRAAAVLAQMTQDEKLQMVHGGNYLLGDYVGDIKGNTRLGIPDILMNDGPQGFRAQKAPGTSTQWPCGLAIAASWNQSAARAWGDGMGGEFYAKGANVQLGPGVCVARVPVNGRNFEYLSGEDPYLGAALVGPAVQGIQAHNVIANVKHYIGNNQETKRMSINSLIDERTRMQIYAPPFAAAVDAGVLSFMCSYNQVNGHHACENNQTLNTELKGLWGFKGWVMSDWTATKSTAAAANSGLDQEMPLGIYFSKIALGGAISSGKVPQAALDGMVSRILYGMFAGGLFDKAPSGGNARTDVTGPALRQAARDIAVDSAVLLRNAGGALPLAAASLRSVAVIGAAAGDKGVVTGGGGSGAVVPKEAVSVLSALRRRLPAANVTYDDGSDAARAAALAKAADAAVVVIATSSSEGADRKDLGLADAALASAVGAAQPRTAAVVIAPGAVLTDWADNVGALLVMFMPGEQEGEAAADVLLGQEPGGRLPLTFPNKENEVGFTAQQYPGVGGASNYSEQLEVGYRWYHARNATPRYPFGHGLSYTTFEYSGLTATSDMVSCTVKNTGATAGIAVPQLYLDYPATAGEPPRQLRGFNKLRLAAGASAAVNFPLTARDTSVWDAAAHQWQRVSGTFRAYVGASSAELPLSGDVVVA